MLAVKELTKSYHDAGNSLVIVRELSYQFPEQGSLAIVGQSGVGKSTLLHMLGGLDRPTAGSIFYDTCDITTLSPAKLTAFRGQSVGFIFQFHHLLPEFNAVENVMMPLLIQGVSPEVAEERARRMLDRVGVGHRVTHRPGALSGGEQQRVAIARAVVHEPKVLLADEPTGNLDATTAHTVQGLLHEINRELKNLLIVVTHSQDLARSMGAQLEMLPGGELVQR